MTKKELKQLIKEVIMMNMSEADENDPFRVFKGNLFSVDPFSKEAQSLMPHIGDWVSIKGGKGANRLLPFKIIHLQKNYKDQIIYRVQNQLTKFGMPLNPNEVDKYFDETEAQKMWNANYMNYIKELMRGVKPEDLPYYVGSWEKFVPFSPTW